jgi:hypothetical protein
MKRTILGVTTAIVALAASVSVAQAQNPMSFGLAAGATIPVGDDGDILKTGFHGMATLGFTPALVPFGVRIDGMYHSMETKNVPALDIPEGQGFRVLGVTANGVFSLGGMVASPYLIGGVGYYNGKAEDADESEGDFGLNVGIGAKFNLSGFGTFAEIRYHNIFNGEGDAGNSAFIPITFGIMF